MTRANAAACLLAALLLSAAAVAQPVVSTLDNGLQVCAVEDYAADVVAIEIVLRVSADCEPDTKAGLRTVLQHTLQAGMNERIAEEDDLAFVRHMEDLRGGVTMNTEWEYTGFGYAGVGETASDALKLLAEGVFSAEISEDAYDRSLELVSSVAGGPQSTPGESTYALFRKALLGTTARAYVLGKPETLASVSLSDLKAFHRRFYIPNLTTVCVLGPMPAEEVKNLVAEHFAGLEAGDGRVPEPPAMPTESDTFAQLNAGLAVPNMPRLEIASLVVGVPAPGLDSPDLPAAYVIHALLGADGHVKGRLDDDDELWGMLDLPFEEGHAQANQFIESLTPPFAYRSHLAIHVYADPRQVEAVRKALLAHFVRLAKEPLSARELGEAKEYVRNAYAQLFESPSTRAQVMARGIALGATAPAAPDFGERVAKLKAQDIQRVADTYFSKYAVGVEMPDFAN